MSCHHLPWSTRAVSSRKQRVPLPCPCLPVACHPGPPSWWPVARLPLIPDVSPSITTSWSLTFPVPFATAVAPLNPCRWSEPILVQPHWGIPFSLCQPAAPEEPRVPTASRLCPGSLLCSALPVQSFLRPLSGLTPFPSLSPSSVIPALGLNSYNTSMWWTTKTSSALREGLACMSVSTLGAGCGWM